MCFQRARASSDPLPRSAGVASECELETAVVTSAAEINGWANGIAGLGLRFGSLAGVAERSDVQDLTDVWAVGKVPDKGEQGAVL